MGDSISEGTLLELTKVIGDYVANEEVFAVVETDKVTVELRSPAAGTVTSILAKVDETVIVGDDMIEIDVGVGSPGAEAAAPATEAAEPAAATQIPAAVAPLASGRVHPSGKQSLIRFRSQAPASEPAAALAMPPKPASPPPGPAPSPPRKAPSLGLDEPLPERFRRLPMSDEEMDAVDSGGAGYTF